jgi:hypothetical protein
MVTNTPRLRVYYPIRYGQTEHLVKMMAGLFAKPTSKGKRCCARTLTEI